MPKLLQLPKFILEKYKENHPHVRVFYKYQTWKPYTLSTLQANNIYMSKRHELNDPFDPFLSTIRLANPDIPLGEDDNATKELTILSHASLFCLSEINDNLLLWSHYARSYFGFCIGYAVFIDPQMRIVQPVNYSDEIPQRLCNHKTLTGEDILNLLCLKPRVWAYEKEWRFIICGENAGGITPSPFPIVEIVFGYNMPVEQRISLKKATSLLNPSLKLAQPKLQGCKYFLSIDKFDF